MVKLCHMVAYVEFGVFISGSRIPLSHMHPENRAHYPNNKSTRRQGGDKSRLTADNMSASNHVTPENIHDLLHFH